MSVFRLPLVGAVFALSACTPSLSDEEKLSCLAFAEVILEKNSDEQKSDSFTTGLVQIKFAAREDLAPALRTPNGIYALGDAKRNTKEWLTGIARADRPEDPNDSLFVKETGELFDKCRHGLDVA